MNIVDSVCYKLNNEVHLKVTVCVINYKLKNEVDLTVKN
jgi:hypothetical protein